MIDRIDHLVLTVRSLEDTCRFYERVLGAERQAQPGRPVALLLGRVKINVHALGRSFEPKAAAPTPGAGDLCVVTSWPVPALLDHLAEQGVAVEAGPVGRDGAEGPMTSVYFRDPDGNLIEVSRYEAA